VPGGAASELFDAAPLRTRARSATADGIRVLAALPSSEESREIFASDLGERDVQAIWLEIENRTDRVLWFLPTAVDPEYFAPLEVAFAYHRRFSGDANAEIDRRLQALSFDSRTPIRPGVTASGFVLASHPRAARALDVDLVGERWSQGFSMVLAVPGGAQALDQLTQSAGAYRAAELLRVEDEAALRAMVEGLPCCTSDAAGTAAGPPLNLVLIGDLSAWIPALVRRGYRDTPLSPLHAFGRPQDGSARKLGQWVVAQPQVVRIWHTPIRYGDKPVWIAQVSAPAGGRFASSAADADAVRIAPRVDEARNHLVQDLLYSQAVIEVGFASGAQPARSARPAPDGPNYQTDGLRAVMVFDRRPVALSQIEFFDWEYVVDPPGR
jgi:hypothetical protein